MKILVIQLTRFGDILCTLPALSALRREKPDSEIHFLVRKKFAAAAEGIASVNHLWQFDTQTILRPFIGGSQTVSDGVTELSRFINELRGEKFDLIINLSFSPSSSFISHLISRGTTPVVGYSRTSDFYLNVPDAPSIYFRAQVGLDRSNRVHVADLMGWIAGVELKECDWSLGPLPAAKIQRKNIICHLGASQDQKTWPENSWVGFLQNLTDSGRLNEGEKIILVGSEGERVFAEKVAAQIVDPSGRVENLVGKTSFKDLKAVIASARLFVGADSGPMHVASLCGVRVLNMSVGHVRFWETGPTSKGSRILVSQNPELLGSDHVFKMCAEMLEGLESRHGYIECVGYRTVRYVVHPQAPTLRDSWPLVDWMYFDGPQPRCGGEILTALNQIQEVCDLCLGQLDAFYANPSKVETVGVLDRLDDIFEMLRTHIIPLAPLLENFKVRKENIAPGSREEIFYQTKNCYTDLRRRAAMLSSVAPLEEKGLNP